MPEELVEFLLENLILALNGTNPPMVTRAVFGVRPLS